VVENRIIVKFGGTSVGNGERIRLAARSIADQVREGKEVVVVVSAMGKSTDELLNALAGSTESSYEPDDMVDVVSMGERTSIRIMTAALRSLGVKAEYVEVAMEEWPIITTSKASGSEVIISKTQEMCQKYLEVWLEEGITPVVCGFLGKDMEGSLTTLGRGGSDTTAFILGKCLQASEVIVVTDVEGVLSADPRHVGEAQMLSTITVEEMNILASKGAKVLHPNALRYKTPEMKAKIVHFRHGDLNAPGTEIVGFPQQEVILQKERLKTVTIVGEKILQTPGLLSKISRALADDEISIYGCAVGTTFLGLYVEADKAKRACDILHPIVLEDANLKSLTVTNDIAMIIAKSYGFIETPGVISKLTAPLAERDINIIEMVTIKTDIMIFINWEVREEAYRLIKDVFSRGDERS